MDSTVKSNCFGCRYDKCDQRSHMVCPDGCLHNPKKCLDCSNSSNITTNSNQR